MDKNEKIRACYLIKAIAVSEAYNAKIEDLKKKGKDYLVKNLINQKNKQYEAIYRKILEFDQSLPLVDKNGNEYKSGYTFLIEELFEREGFDTVACGKNEFEPKVREVMKCIALSYSIRFYTPLLKRAQAQLVEQGLPKEQAVVTKASLIANVRNKLENTFPQDKYPKSKKIVSDYVGKEEMTSILEQAYQETIEYYDYVAKLNNNKLNSMKMSFEAGEEATSDDAKYVRVDYNTDAIYEDDDELTLLEE